MTMRDTPPQEPEVPDEDEPIALIATESLSGPTAGEPETATTMGRQHVRGSALLLLGRVTSLLFTVATQVVVVRALTKDDFGAFAYALALAAAGRTMLSLGQGRLLSRFMSMYEEQRDYNRMFGAMFLAIGTIVVTSTGLVALLYGFHGALVGSAVKDPQAFDVLLILVFLAPLEALDQVFVSIFAVFSKPRAIFFRKYVLTPALRLIVVLALALSGASVMFLAIGYVATGVFGIFIYAVLLTSVLKQRQLLHHLRLRTLVAPYKAVFAFSFPLLTGDLVFLSMNFGSVVQLGYFGTTSDVADYRAVFPAARLNQVVFAVFVTMFLPMAARLFARNDHGGMRRSYWQTAVFLAVFTFPVFALTGPFAPSTTNALFGVRYSDSSSVLALLSIGYYFNVMLGFNAFTLQVYGRIRYLVGVNVFCAVLNVALGFLLIPHLVAAGVAIANCVTLIAQNVLNQLALRSCLNTSFIDRAYLRCYGIIAACTAALWLLQLALHPGIVVSVALAGVGSLVVLLLNKRTLDLPSTFPELMKIPIARRLLQ
jgi:O-antigen/teichoic acid export membrane protein